MVEYRPVSEDYADDYRDILNYAFRAHEGPLGSDADEHLYPSFGERRGLFEDDELVCICRHYVLDTRLRGGRYDMGGFTVIATPPEHRRQGYVSEITSRTLQEYRDRDIAISALWPFDYDFYRYFGWGTANHYSVYDLAPLELSFARDAGSGSYRRLSPDESRDLEPVLDDHGDSYELSIRRPPDWWRERTFSRHGVDRFVYAWERDGEVRGYLAYHIEPLEQVDQRDKGKTQLQVHDMAWTDREAYLNLLRFCFNHEAQVDTVRLTGPPDLDLLDDVESPTGVDATTRPGAMFRLVDVPAAVEMLDYPHTVEGRVVLAVSDEHAPWNDGTFELAVADGEATCRPTDDDPDVELDVSRLSQLYVGARSLDDLLESGHATTTDRDSAAVLSQLFPESTVYLREFF